MPAPPLLYQTLADSLAQALRDGRWRAGDRLPSVRELCQAHRLSLATVNQALHQLEDAGWIEARPRRGFFVRSVVPQPPPLAPAAAALALEGRRQRLMSMAASLDGHVSLSHLALAPALLPVAALRRLASRALATHPEGLCTGSVHGSPALREQLAHRLGRAGMAASADELVVTHGDGESLQLCLDMLTVPGDCVAVASPGSLRALDVAAAKGLRAVELPLLAQGDGWPAVQALLARERPAACVIDLSFHAAAAGPLRDAQKQALARLLAAHRVPVIEFDLMGELHHGSERARPLKAFDTEDAVTYCGSFASTLGPGFTLGFIAGGRHRLQLRAARAVHGDLVPHLTDQVLAEFLAGAGFDTHLRRLRSRLRPQVSAWARAVKRHFPPGTRVCTSDAGYVLWVELPAGLVASDLLEPMRAAGYTFIPGSAFSPAGRLDHCLRLAAAHPLDERRLAGLKLLGQTASALLGCGR